MPFIPDYATNNGHMFYLVCTSENERNRLIEHLKSKEINAVFHYLSLHKSPYYSDKYVGPELNETDRYSACLVRLPFFYDLEITDQNRVIKEVLSFYRWELIVWYVIYFWNWECLIFHHFNKVWSTLISTKLSWQYQAYII